MHFEDLDQEIVTLRLLSLQQGKEPCDVTWWCLFDPPINQGTAKISHVLTFFH